MFLRKNRQGRWMFDKNKSLWKDGIGNYDIPIHIPKIRPPIKHKIALDGVEYIISQSFYDRIKQDIEWGKYDRPCK